jgi:putative Mn2+ efflux pump MntP
MTFFQVLLIGIGLSMDAAAVSMTNGLAESKMKTKKVLLIAGAFGIFQGFMPMIGYFAGSVFANFFTKITPYLALILLVFIGIKMIMDAFKNDTGINSVCLTKRILLMQAVATSIDALAVGLVFVSTPVGTALLDFLLIAIVTFLISIFSIFIGKKFGDFFSNKAQIVGGIILIFIGLKIFIDYMITIL